jgi:hypothetical protein
VLLRGVSGETVGGERDERALQELVKAMKYKESLEESI